MGLLSFSLSLSLSLSCSVIVVFVVVVISRSKSLCISPFIHLSLYSEIFHPHTDAYIYLFMRMTYLIITNEHTNLSERHFIFHNYDYTFLITFILQVFLLSGLRWLFEWPLNVP